MCDVCLGMGFECHYQDPAKRRASAASTNYSSPLEGRLEVMETLVRELLSKSNQRQVPETPWTDSVSIAEMQMLEAPTSEMRLYTDSVDGMCAITFAGESVSGYFGMALVVP